MDNNLGPGRIKLEELPIKNKISFVDNFSNKKYTPDAEIASIVGNKIKKIQENMSPQTAKKVNTAVDLAAVAAIPVSGGLSGVWMVGKALDRKALSTNQKKLDKFRQDLETYGHAQTPKIKKRITLLGQILFILFAVIVDVVNAIVEIPDDIFVAAITNRIIDIIVGIIFLLYAFFKGLTLSDNWGIYVSIFGTIVGEFIPVASVAPFFTLDAWYITHSLKKRDSERQKEIDRQATEILNDYKQRKWMEAYEEEKQEKEESGEQNSILIEDQDSEGRIPQPEIKQNNYNPNKPPNAVGRIPPKTNTAGVKIA